MDAETIALLGAAFDAMALSDVQDLGIIADLPLATHQSDQNECLRRFKDAAYDSMEYSSFSAVMFRRALAPLHMVDLSPALHSGVPVSRYSVKPWPGLGPALDLLEVTNVVSPESPPTSEDEQRPATKWKKEQKASPASQKVELETSAMMFDYLAKFPFAFMLEPGALLKPFMHKPAVDPGLTNIPRCFDEFNTPVLKEMRGKCGRGVFESRYDISTDEVSISPMQVRDGNLPSASVIRSSVTDIGSSVGCKVWLIVPTEESHKVHSLARKLYNKAPRCQHPVDHKVLYFSPKLLATYGIRFELTMQEPGDMMVVKEGVLHQVVTFGCMLTEVVNITTALSSVFSDLFRSCHCKHDAMRSVQLGFATVHAHLVSEETAYRCLLCGVAWWDKGLLEAHLRQHLDGGHFPSCCPGFANAEELRLHVRDCHTIGASIQPPPDSPNPGNVYPKKPCVLCGKPISTNNSAAHLTNCQQKVECGLCKKRYKPKPDKPHNCKRAVKPPRQRAVFKSKQRFIKSPGAEAVSPNMNLSGLLSYWSQGDSWYEDQLCMTTPAL